MGTSTNDSASAGSADSSAPSPRPSPRLVITVQHLPSQFEVCGGATGLEIVKHDRLAVARRFRKPNVPWNDGIEHLSGKVPVHLVANLEREARPAVEHREHDPQDIETRVELLSHEPHGLLEEMGQPFERVELTLEWHEDAIGGHQSVDRQETQRRWAIDDDVVVGSSDRLQRRAQLVLASINADQLDLGSDEIDVGRQQLQAGQARSANRLLGGLAPQEHVIDRGMKARLLDP